MKIPPSVVVMSLLTAVPFGLAFRDMARGHDKIGGSHHDDDDFASSDGADPDLEARMAAEEAEYAKQRAEERTREAAQDEKRSAVVNMLVSGEPASMGSLFAGVKLGASSSTFQPDDVRENIAKYSEVLTVNWDLDSTQLNGLTARIKGSSDYGSCSSLRSAVNLWGASENDVWENATTHQRATFEEGNCEIKFERFAELAKWIDKTPTSIVPLDVIGQAPAKLHDKVASKLDDDNEDGFRWHDLSLSGTGGATHLQTVIENGKIKAVVVDLDHVSTATTDALSQRITKLLGTKPVENEGDGSLTWKGRVPVMFDGTTLTIGKL